MNNYANTKKSAYENVTIYCFKKRNFHNLVLLFILVCLTMYSFCAFLLEENEQCEAVNEHSILRIVKESKQFIFNEVASTLNKFYFYLKFGNFDCKLVAQTTNRSHNLKKLCELHVDGRIKYKNYHTQYNLHAQQITPKHNGMFNNNKKINITKRKIDKRIVLVEIMKMKIK
ncbi:hypothetical protein RFI_14784, partial [Reticulomyxa filosa]